MSEERTPARFSDDVTVAIDTMTTPQRVLINGMSSWDARTGVVELLLKEYPFIRWTKATLIGADHRLEVGGVDTEGNAYHMIVTRVAGGFRGTGSIEAARILAALGFGEEEQILNRISRPNRGFLFRDEWRSVYEFESVANEQ